MGLNNDTRYENVVLPMRGKTRAFAVTTSQSTIDFETEFPDDYHRGRYFSLISDVELQVQMSTAADDTIGPDVVSDDGSGESSEDTNEQTFTILADTEKPFLLVHEPAHYFLHVIAASAGTLRIAVTGHERT